MTIGVCYFPEHWSREQWGEQVTAMADAGFDYVRMGEFSWGRIEPERDDLRLDWLADAVELVGEHGMSVVLCTPTATPPKWLTDEDPSILAAERDGTTREFGSRRHYCFNSPAYRRETRRIVRAMANRFVDSPYVTGWQIDNEYGCHRTARCYCDDCATAFREWLRERYGDVVTLNERWGTTFWSQQYRSIEAVDPPGPGPGEHHPSRLLDYYRFANDSIVDYNRLQAELLREHDDEWILTHNFMGDFETVDAHDVSDDLDLVGWDSYPTGFVQDRIADDPSTDELRAGDPDQIGLNHDLYRSILDQPFWVMEQQPGDVNWPPHAPQPADGAMRLWAHHAVAHGADSVLYFRWQRCREGQEQYHAGLRKRDGSPDRGYADAATAAAELEPVDHVDAPVAILHEYDNWWALSEQPHAPDFDYWEHLRTYYRALRARGVQVDIVQPTESLDDYAVVVAPTLHLVDEDQASHLSKYVRGGGVLLTTIRTGVKDRANKLHETLTPGPLTDLLGVEQSQRESLPPSVPTELTFRDDTYAYRTWAEWLDPTEATTQAVYTTGAAEGEPAIVARDVDDGHVVHCGVWPKADLADALVTDVLRTADVAHTHRLPEGVRVAERGGRTWILNFTGDQIVVDASNDAEWLLAGEILGGTGADIDAFDVGIVDAPAVDLTVRSY